MIDDSPAVFIRKRTALNTAILLQNKFGLDETPKVRLHVVQGETRGYVLFDRQVLSNDYVTSVLDACLTRA